MRLTPNMRRAIQVVGCVLLAATGALANTITVSNFSFENLPLGGLTNTCGLGCSFSAAAIPGWTISGTGGQFVPGTQVGNLATFNTLSDGNTSAWIATSSVAPAMISQTVVPTVQLGFVYTLLVDIGWRKDTPLTGGAQLLINGSPITGSFVSAPVQGAFNTYAITYVGTAGDVGSAITIQLLAGSVIPGTFTQGNFDNVRLDAAAPGGTVPEPASAGMVGLVLLGLAKFTARKRA